MSEKYPDIELDTQMVSEPVAAYNVSDYHHTSIYNDDDDDEMLALDKESYTPEELREMLVSDIKKIYGVKDAI